MLLYALTLIFPRLGCTKNRLCIISALFYCSLLFINNACIPTLCALYS